MSGDRWLTPVKFDTSGRHDDDEEEEEEDEKKFVAEVSSRYRP